MRGRSKSPNIRSTEFRRVVVCIAIGGTDCQIRFNKLLLLLLHGGRCRFRFGAYSVEIFFKRNAATLRTPLGSSSRFLSIYSGRFIRGFSRWKIFQNLKLVTVFSSRRLTHQVDTRENRSQINRIIRSISSISWPLHRCNVYNRIICTAYSEIHDIRVFRSLVPT